MAYCRRQLVLPIPSRGLLQHNHNCCLLLGTACAVSAGCFASSFKKKMEFLNQRIFIFLRLLHMYSKHFYGRGRIVVPMKFQNKQPDLAHNSTSIFASLRIFFLVKLSNIVVFFWGQTAHTEYTQIRTVVFYMRLCRCLKWLPCCSDAGIHWGDLMHSKDMTKWGEEEVNDKDLELWHLIICRSYAIKESEGKSS